MDTSLPQPVRLRLDQALAQWRSWSPRPRRRPVFESNLVGGRSNTSIRVEDGERSWVVRVDGFDPMSLGLNRGAEHRCLMNASAAGLAPRPVYWNPDCRVLVCEFLSPDADATGSLEAIADLLRRIHALPALHSRLDPLRRARRYLDLAGGGDLPPGLVAACERLAAEPTEPRLCHNDLLHPNRLCHRGQLLALDWEYAAMGDPWFDLAVIIEGDGLDEAQAIHLHSAWLERAPVASEVARLEDQRIVYQELAMLWEKIPR